MPGRSGHSQLPSFAEENLRVLTRRDVAAVDHLPVVSLLPMLQRPGAQQQSSRSAAAAAVVPRQPLSSPCFPHACAGSRAGDPHCPQCNPQPLGLAAALRHRLWRCGAVALWRRRSPASYARWRQLPPALLRLTMASAVSARVFHNGLCKWELNGSMTGRRMRMPWSPAPERWFSLCW